MPGWSVDYPYWQAPLFLAVLAQDSDQRSTYTNAAKERIFETLLVLSGHPNPNEFAAVFDALPVLNQLTNNYWTR
jgi:hypothetical protein